MSNNLSYTLYQAPTGNRETKTETRYPKPFEVHDKESFLCAIEWQYSPIKFAHWKRKSANFISSNVVIMDIDNKHSDDPKEWLEPEGIKQLFPDVAYYWETSRNHMKTKHKGEEQEKGARPRFHILFPLGCEISDREEYKALKDKIYDCYPVYFDRDDLTADQIKFVSAHPQTGIVEGSKTILEYLKEHEPQQETLSIHSGEDTLLSEKLAPLEDLYKSKSEPKNDSKKKDLFIYNQAYYQACLDCIDPCELSREEWLQVGMALKRLGMPSEMFFEWCVRDPDRVGDIEGEWNSFKSDLPEGKGFSGKTLTHMAIERVGESAFYKGLPAECWRKPDVKELFLDTLEDEKELTLEEICKLSKRKINKLTIPEIGPAAIKGLHAIKIRGEGLYTFHPKHGFENRRADIEGDIGELFQCKLTPQKVKSIYDFMRQCAPEKEEAPKELIQFKNCILNTKTWETMPCSPDIFIRNRIPWNYNPQAPAVDIVDKVLDDWACGDPEVRLQLLECAGYTLLRYTPIHAFFLLIGPKRNGKSTYCGMVAALNGPNNYASVPLDEIEDRFQKVVYYNKLSNICTENKGSFMKENTTLKKVTSGDPINVEPKGQHAFNYNCIATMIFAFNETFRISDSAGAIKERMYPILLKGDFSDIDKQDHSLRSKLTEKEAMEYFARISVEALKGVLERDRFTVPAEAAQWVEKQNKLNNPILEFIENCENEESLLDDSWMRTPITLGKDFLTINSFNAIYEYHKDWARERNVTPKGAALFSQSICTLKRMETYRKKDSDGRKKTYFRYCIEADPIYS